MQNIDMLVKQIEKELYKLDYDDLSDYLKRVRDFINLIKEYEDSESITEYILEQIANNKWKRQTMDKLLATITALNTYELLTDEQKKDLVEGYLIPEVAKNNYIELGNILSDMLQDQIDITRKELLRNEF